jgi:Raf kinase inhibitor-like YbhB/YbcL family protein
VDAVGIATPVGFGDPGLPVVAPDLCPSAALADALFRGMHRRHYRIVGMECLESSQTLKAMGHHCRGMVSRRRLLASADTAVLAGCSAGDDGASTVGTPAGDLAVSSAAFDHGESIPERYTGDGADVSPPLAVPDVSAEAAELALLVDDPDAPDQPFPHRLCWQLPADLGEIPEAIPQQERVPELGSALQGENDFGELGYCGPLPPADDGPRRYRFTVMALETTLGLDPGDGRAAGDDALGGRVLARGRLVGRYGR